MHLSLFYKLQAQKYDENMNGKYEWKTNVLQMKQTNLLFIIGDVFGYFLDSSIS